jgi:hypothetical protein
MYRHRFITNMVALHLLEFTQSNPGATHTSVLRQDALSILKRVSVFTGHRDPESLLAYVDLAWDELGVFGRATPSSDLLLAVESTSAAVRSLVDSLPRARGKGRQAISERIHDEFASLIATVRGDASKRR